MILTVDEIGPRGLFKTETIERETLESWLTDAGEKQWTASGQGRLEAQFEKVNADVLMKAKASIPLSSPCARCLKPTAVEIQLDFMTCFVRIPLNDGTERSADRKTEGKKSEKFQDEDGTEASFSLDGPDEEPFDGRTIDTDGVLSQEFLVNLPLTALCSEDCRGLCSRCGADLNAGDCGCDRRVMDPRWEALKHIKLDKK